MSRLQKSDCVFSVLQYGVDTWTLTELMCKKIKALLRCGHVGKC